MDGKNCLPVLALRPKTIDIIPLKIGKLKPISLELSSAVSVCAQSRFMTNHGHEANKYWNKCLIKSLS
jgi:hypothetical protein